MAYGVSNGHMIADVTWLWKPKPNSWPPIRLERIMLKTAGDAILQQSLITRESAVRQCPQYGWLS